MVGILVVVIMILRPVVGTRLVYKVQATRVLVCVLVWGLVKSPITTNTLEKVRIPHMTILGTQVITQVGVREYMLGVTQLNNGILI
jgi:hypothetical protein|tara:strand:- start:64 stop:321 length:258 start_codon:yes stop_codon:yes gene_type:complete